MGWAEAELSLTLVGDRAMARLNRETFGRRGPTNVIAFPVDVGKPPVGGGDSKTPPPPPPPPAPSTPDKISPSPFILSEPPDQAASSGPPPMLGEVVISLETTTRQAAETGWPWEELFDFYLIHGILHLIGYDHDTPEADAAMTAKTWELLEMLRGGGG